MRQKERPFYYENHIKRVRYDLAWIDPTFAGWLEQVYKNPKTALDRWASVVSIKPGDDVAKSLSTGGRVFVYNLKKPYPDQVSGLPCYQIDVKGVGLTKSGYLYNIDEFEPHDHRLELMWHPSRQIYLGYENLARQLQTVRDLRAARRRGQAAPIPLAVLNLKQMSLEGEILSINRLRKTLRLEASEDFALVIRGYPITATRINDLTVWHELGTPKHVDTPDIDVVNWARTAWSKHELPKILAAADGAFDKDPSRLYFQWFLHSAYHELMLMFATGFSPATSFETDTGARHTHLQNHTTANSHVEWSPLGRIKDTQSDSFRQLGHLRTLIVAEHDAVVNTGACCLRPSDFHLIPCFDDFLHTLYLKTRKEASYLTHSLFQEIRRCNIRMDLLHARGDGLRHLLVNNPMCFTTPY